MSGKRAGLFEEEGPDLSDFRPKPPARAEQVKALAEEAGFRSREPLRQAPLPPPPAPAASPAREQRRYRTGRNQQLNLKVRPQDADALYAIADAQGWVLGEAFAHAIAALTRELDAKE
ncbi:stability/partitioning determinant [Paracraurococcus ruber]|uniref:Stability/partitioning determinant n=1 Tax=Paracraurococcus ruber TaxID=77675 RepID=A0ABS1D710_9PROT|nr:stability/partitioning determinant [Paracraurococcus ruber]MBK1662120.1 hypothetical protein [Paracraurococcus ruber]TDG29737.1 stability/partitioning determinant [Paracraurococcus ruber]